ncbi:MAG: CoA-binding protein [Candidatus Bathyarchaeota archaeon]|nr:CoA-binding protein [Candidatus Bathyarchaeota archaeon]
MGGEEDLIKDILTRYKIIAIVGLSRSPQKDSYRVAKYLVEHGFKIIPVNPNADEILGEECYASLLEIPIEKQRAIEVVDIFRPPNEVPRIVEQAIQLRKLHNKPHVIWMQLGIVNEHAASMAKDAGFVVIMDRCIMREHRLLFKE